MNYFECKYCSGNGCDRCHDGFVKCEHCMGVGRVMGETCTDCKGNGLKNDSFLYGKNENFKSSFGCAVSLLVVAAVIGVIFCVVR